MVHLYQKVEGKTAEEKSMYLVSTYIKQLANWCLLNIRH